jgi:hypothetical protein
VAVTGALTASEKPHRVSLQCRPEIELGSQFHVPHNHKSCLEASGEIILSGRIPLFSRQLVVINRQKDVTIHSCAIFKHVPERGLTPPVLSRR